MKRSHDEIGKRSAPNNKLGALEFAAAVNGDDVRAVLSALRRFTKTIRRQRRQALLRNEHDDKSFYDSCSEEEEVTKDEALTKKPRKLEAWMEDTEDFNVPFIGTSVAKGDTGTVVPGQWPTGLLQAYLKASPMAVELTSGDLIPPSGHVHKRLLSHKTKHGNKASHAIYKAYLQALAELITAHVPISVLQRDYGIETETQDQSTLTKDSMISVILRERLVGIMALINQETGGGKAMDRALVGIALRILANLSATSLGAAREVTRALDGSLKDGILKSLLRPNKPEKDDETTDAGTNDNVRMECLRLATVLAEWQDAAITSYITTKGSRERKINAGILHIAVRLGLNDIHANDDDAYPRVVARLLRILGLLLPDADSATRRPLMSTRDLLDLFSGEALVHISQIATCAPPLADLRSIQDMVSGNDLHSEGTPMEAVGIKSRRLLFVFLADSAQSPFLLRINHSKTGDNQATHSAQQLVRAMVLLLQSRPSLPMQRSLIHCLRTTPMLVLPFVKMISVPDPKQSFAFIARMAFLFRLLREAPPVASCIESGAHLDAQQVEQILAAIVPANLKKHILSKGLQSPNALIVSETLKLLYALIDRFRCFVGDTKGKAGEEEFHKSLADAFVRRLPDLQPLVSVRSRFDPFGSEGDMKVSAIVLGHVCKVLDSCALYLPDIILNAKFDWKKLLPTNAETFCFATPLLQFQLLQTLQNILGLKQV